MLQAHAVLAALPHVQVARQSRGGHDQSLKVLAMAFSICFALHAKAAVDLAEVCRILIRISLSNRMCSRLHECDVHKGFFPAYAL
jgi:hypothetical protein